jgi:anti-sigma regulatory factor (Ser/Thr protein kinase)
VLRLRLVVEELVANLVEHAAWPADRLPARLRVTWRSGRLSAVLEDAAAPFDPTTAPGPEVPRLDDDKVGGLGLGLVRKMTAELQYDSGDGWNRTEFAIRAG